MGKKILTILAILLVILGVYLVFPPLTHFPLQRPVSLFPIDNDHGRACETGTIYVKEETRAAHQNEEYSFVVDDPCAELQKNLVSAIEKEDLASIRSLISEGANPQTADWSRFEGRFPLYVASFQGPETLAILLDSGVDVNKEFCCCASCDTPLTAAIVADHPETVRLLLERGASVEFVPSFTDSESYSPLDLAVQVGNPEIIELLVAGACERTLVCRIKSRARKIRHFVGI